MDLSSLKAHLAVSCWAATSGHAPLRLPDSPAGSPGKPALTSSQNEPFPPGAHVTILTWSNCIAAARAPVLGARGQVCTKYSVRIPD